MANRYFNKQVTESRKPLAVGGAALRGWGVIKSALTGGKKTSSTISSVGATVHKTKKAQKDARMKILFDKQKSRTLHERKMGKKEPTLTEYANRKLTTRERNEASKKMFDDANGKK